MFQATAESYAKTSRKKPPVVVLILKTGVLIGEQDTERQALEFVTQWNRQQPTQETFATYRVPPRPGSLDRRPRPKRPVDRKAKPVPTLDEIRQRAATIRDSWPPREERKRRAWAGSRWEVPCSSLCAD